MSFIELKGVEKSYHDGQADVPVLLGIDLTINKGELLVIMGPSGCGKTTLLNLIAGIDTPDKGLVKVNKNHISSMDDQSLTDYRKHSVGYVFQFFNLIPTLTALENVELALQIKGQKNLSKAGEMLEKVGLGDKKGRFPSQLSGGEQQRVALARALVKDPLLLIGDEPTGNLDAQTSKEVLQIIKDMSKETGTTFILATHDENYTKIAGRVVDIRDGVIV